MMLLYRSLAQGLRTATLALCTYRGSGYAIHSQLAWCAWSSNELYHGIAGADTDFERGFNAAPDAIWAKGDAGSPKYYRGALWDNWNLAGEWSGWPLSVRCVVALENLMCSCYTKRSGLELKTTDADACPVYRGSRQYYLWTDSLLLL